MTAPTPTRSPASASDAATTPGQPPFRDVVATLTLIRDFAASKALVRNDALDHIQSVASAALKHAALAPVGVPESVRTATADAIREALDAMRARRGSDFDSAAALGFLVAEHETEILAALAAPAVPSVVVPESVRRLCEATREVVRAAWTLTDNTADGGTPLQTIDPDDWTALAHNLTYLTSLIPEAEQPASAGHAVTLVLSAITSTPSGRADTPLVSGGAVEEALAEFQRRNGYHRPEIEELLSEFGELLLSKVSAAPAAPEPAAGGGREILQRMAAASRSLAEFPPDGLVKGDLYVAVKNEGQGTGWRYRTVGITVGDLDEARSILSAPTGAETAGGDGLSEKDICQVADEVYCPSHDAAGERLMEARDFNAGISRLKKALLMKLSIRAELHSAPPKPTSADAGASKQEG